MYIPQIRRNTGTYAHSFKLLNKKSLKLRLRKCTFAQTENVYLGLIVGNGTVRPDPEKIKVVKDWPLPSTQKELKSFVQCCSFYGRFIHHFSDCSAHLTDMLKKCANGIGMV